MTVLSIRVDDTLAQAIKELALDDERPVSTYLERVIRQHAAERGKNVAARLPRAEQAARAKKPAKGRKP